MESFDSSSNSDISQGFEASSWEISQQDHIRNKLQFQKRPTDFQARHIFAEGIIKKQPMQCYRIIDKLVGNEISPKIKRKIEGSRVETIGTPHQLFVLNPSYQLVYTRYKDPFGQNDSQFSKNPIILQHLSTYSEENYKLLRPFDEQANQEEIESPHSHYLEISSKFEGGNLMCAFKSKTQQNKYVLFMHNDTNTYGYNQWFYFSIKRAKAGVKYRFQIVNFKKSFSFFKLGMQIVCFSLTQARLNGNGWSRKGENISYSKSPIIDPLCHQTAFYRLSFEFTPQHNNDYITLSSGIPYSYSRLIHNIDLFKQSANKDIDFDLRCAGYTLANNQVPCITLKRKSNLQTIEIASIDQIHQIKIQPKKIIIIFARQHSGQTWSSFLMQSILHQLSLCTSESARYLLEHYTIKIYPMINIDGVIYGNFRCDLGGSDLNRCWKDPSHIIHPQVHHIKKQIQRMVARGQQIELVLDLHGHSKDFNIFGYCCRGDSSNQQCKKFPFLISKSNALFHFPSCTFGISKEKRSTARATIFGLTKNINTITIQISAFGSRIKNQIKAFEPYHLNQMAVSILQSAKQYLSKDQSFLREIQKQISERKEEFDQYEKMHEQEDASGSDSDPEGDELPLAAKIASILPPSYVKQLQKKKDKKKKSIIQIEKKKKKSTILASKRKSAKAIERCSISKEVSRPVQSKMIESKNNTVSRCESFKKDKISQQIASQVVVMHQFQSTNSTKTPFHKRDDKKFSKKVMGYSESQQSQKPLNLIEFSLKKLPFFAYEKIPITPIQLQQKLNVQIVRRQRFDKTYSAYEAMCRPRAKQVQQVHYVRKVTKDNSLLNGDDMPFLCILSENKKKIHLDKLKERMQGIRESNKGEVLSRLKEKQLDNAAYITKIWRDNVNRYNRMGKTAQR